jgi:hypothetical protein
VTSAIAESGGKDGSSLLPKLTTLANFADFAAAGGFPDAEGVSHSPIDIFSVQIGDAIVAEYLRWERARGYVEGWSGLAPQALTNLRFARDHLGLDAPDLTSDLVLSAAQLSVDHAAGESVAQPKGSGSLPLRLIAGQEQLANARGGRAPPSLPPPARRTTWRAFHGNLSSERVSPLVRRRERARSSLQNDDDAAGAR